jgi:hypothetical protein
LAEFQVAKRLPKRVALPAVLYGAMPIALINAWPFPSVFSFASSTRPPGSAKCRLLLAFTIVRAKLDGGRVVAVGTTVVEEANKLTGLASDTDLLEFALANVAVKDDFPDAFRKLKGTVDPTLDLEF